MSSIGYSGWDQGEGGIVDSAAQIATGVDAALVATEQAQAGAAAFIAKYGAEVLGGHDDVTGPGGSPPDNDMGGPDASDV